MSESGTVANQVIIAGTALAGLVLVFLGGIFNAYEAYDTEQKSAVQRLYQRRAVTGLVGFLLSVLAVASAFAAMAAPCWAYVGLTLLALSAVALVILAIMSVADLFD